MGLGILLVLRFSYSRIAPHLGLAHAKHYT